MRVIISEVKLKLKAINCGSVISGNTLLACCPMVSGISAMLLPTISCRNCGIMLTKVSFWIVARIGLAFSALRSAELSDRFIIGPTGSAEILPGVNV